LEEQLKLQEEMAKPQLTSSSDFPLLPGQTSYASTARFGSVATIFNKKSFAEEDFPSLPQAPPRKLNFSQEELNPTPQAKKKPGKKGQVFCGTGNSIKNWREVM